MTTPTEAYAEFLADQAQREKAMAAVRAEIDRLVAQGERIEAVQKRVKSLSSKPLVIPPDSPPHRDS